MLTKFAEIYFYKAANFSGKNIIAHHAATQKLHDHKMTTQNFIICLTVLRPMCNSFREICMFVHTLP